MLYIKKKSNKREKRWKNGEKGGKRGNFHCTWGKKYLFLKKRGGAKILYFGRIYTPEFLGCHAHCPVDPRRLYCPGSRTGM